MFDDHEIARVVLNASLTLMSIFVAVIAFLAIEYISAEIHRRPALHRQTRNHVNLITIADPAVILAP